MKQTLFNENCPSYAGVSTFQNIPFQAELDGMDYAVVGIPYDCSSVMRADARFGPNDMRSEPSFKSGIGWSSDLQIQVGDDFCGTDLGEAPIKFGYLTPSLRIAEEYTAKIINKGAISIAVGGGQIITLAELRAVKKKYGKVALVHFDSNRDVRNFGAEYDDATAIRKVIEEELIDPAHSIQLGIRGGYYSKEECDYAKDLGMKVLTASQMHEMTRSEIMSVIAETVGDMPCFISVDMSFVDPAFAPGVTTPVSGGFASVDIRQIIRYIGVELDVKAMDVVDFTPSYDPGHITAQLVESIMRDSVAAFAKRKANKNGGKNNA